MKITVIVSGYIGLVSGVCLAELGNNLLLIFDGRNPFNLATMGLEYHGIGRENRA